MRTSYKNPAIHKAFDYLEMLSADDRNRYLAEIREKSLKNERSELSAAKKAGIEIGIRQVSLKLLRGDCVSDSEMKV